MVWNAHPTAWNQ
jgi:hypothetical protein